MELLLIRHGLPQRVERTDGGAADPPLADAGWVHARAMARWLASEAIDAVYTSPLQRAVQTARPLGDVTGHDPVVVDEVAEWDRAHGSYIPIEELRAMHRAGDGAALAALLAGATSDERKAWRPTVAAAVEQLVERHGGGRIAVVCHAGVINAYVTHVLGVERPLVFEPHYTSVNRIVAARSGERSVLSLNEAPWLRAHSPEPTGRR